MSRFYELEPTLENYWRAIILFGRNSASYKFALAKSLIDLRSQSKSAFSLDELAVPYAHHLCEHLKTNPKQVTSKQSKFLEHLNQYNAGKTNHNEMIEQTVRFGFNNVIDAFHNVHEGEIGARFFIDKRKAGGGIELTDTFWEMGLQNQCMDLGAEVESRWRLVETAWENNISRNLMLIGYDSNEQMLVGVNKIKRVSVTSARPALNGYQKGQYFYCFKEISITTGNDDLADVDHFFPHKLKVCAEQKPVDGVANLVLSCSDCNRGTEGKFDRIPSTQLLERLFQRNEYLITSQHPLKETLMSQTGNTKNKRESFLQDVYNCATLYTGSHHKWEPKAQASAIF